MSQQRRIKASRARYCNKMKCVSVIYSASNLWYWKLVKWKKNTSAGRKQPLLGRMFLSSRGRNLQLPAGEHCSYCGCFLRCFLQLFAQARVLYACVSTADRHYKFNDFHGVCLSLQLELKVIEKCLCFSSAQRPACRGWRNTSRSVLPFARVAVLMWDLLKFLCSPAQVPCFVSALV